MTKLGNDLTSKRAPTMAPFWLISPRRRSLGWNSATMTRRWGPWGYWSSLVTICCVLLAWARAEMPVWVRISYFDMFEVVAA